MKGRYLIVDRKVGLLLKGTIKKYGVRQSAACSLLRLGSSDEAVVNTAANHRVPIKADTFLAC
jgi:hypothetical protein